MPLAIFIRTFIVSRRKKRRLINTAVACAILLYLYNEKMHHILVFIFWFYCFSITLCSTNNIPVIYNVSLEMLDYNSTIINGTCHDCLCTMIMNSTMISAFNCFQNNNTCEIFSKSLKTDSFSFMNNTASSVYFISLPINDSATAITSATQNTSSFTSQSLFS